MVDVSFNGSNGFIATFKMEARAWIKDLPI